MTEPLPADSGPAAPGRSRGPAVRAAVLLLVGALLGGGGAVLATTRHGDSPAAAGVVLARPGSAPAVLAQAPAPDPMPAVAPPSGVSASPVSLDIPRIGVHSRLTDLHLDLDGTLQVPQDYGVAGWYSDGPLPGDLGAPAVVVGHVDSKDAPGIFYRLSSLAAGDAVLITRADGSLVRFEVYAAADYRKDAFPAEQVYAATTQPELRLVTCTGTFDRAAGHYLSNRVVYARLASPPTQVG